MHRIHAAKFSMQKEGQDFPVGIVEMAIGNEAGPAVPQLVETVRKNLLSNTMRVPVHLFGADKVGGNRMEQIRKIVKRSSVPPRQGEILFRLSALFRPDLILELGTSVGLGTLYLSSGHPEARVITVEGNRMLASIAEGIFRQQGKSQITLMQCTFDDALQQLSTANLSRMLVFVDGDHTCVSTLRYFNHLIGKAGKDCLMVFHDIHWSESMHKAWMQIRSDRRIRTTYDLFAMGIAIKTGTGIKKDFVFRY